MNCCCCCLVAKLCPCLCDPMNGSRLGFPVLHYLPEFARTHVHWVSDAIPTISSSVAPFCSCPQSFPASLSFAVSQLFALCFPNLQQCDSLTVIMERKKFITLNKWTERWLNRNVRRVSEEPLFTTLEPHLNSRSLPGKGDGSFWGGLGSSVHRCWQTLVRQTCRLGYKIFPERI